MTVLKCEEINGDKTEHYTDRFTETYLFAENKDSYKGHYNIACEVP